MQGRGTGGLEQQPRRPVLPPVQPPAAVNSPTDQVSAGNGSPRRWFFWPLGDARWVPCYSSVSRILHLHNVTEVTYSFPMSWAREQKTLAVTTVPRSPGSGAARPRLDMKWETLSPPLREARGLRPAPSPRTGRGQGGAGSSSRPREACSPRPAFCVSPERAESD